MILVDVYVPSTGRCYDFRLDEHTPVAELIDEMAGMIAQKEQTKIKGSKEELLLCYEEGQRILNFTETLAAGGVRTGGRLILV